MTANNQMVSARGYARLRGVSHVAVLKNIERGKIRTHGGKINVAEADASLETQKVTFAEALRRKTQAQAEREELRLLQEQNRVVLIETVVAKQIEVNSIIRARLLAIPTKLAPILFGMDSRAKIQARIQEEIYDALSELASHGKAKGRSRSK